MESLTTIPEYIEFNNIELEKIKSRSLKSRVKNECNILYKDYHNVLIDIIPDKTTLTAMEFMTTNNDNITTSKKRVYKFILNSHYPFRPPEIYINNTMYSNILQMKGDYEKKMVKKLKGQDCLCCHSVNCNVNWSPAIKLFNIINEIKDTLKFKRDIINVLLADKIKKKYNIPYAYIERYLV
jgi:ubiquitin-protein ligase